MLQGETVAKTALPPKIFDDLDQLAGTWSSRHSKDFERDTAAFAFAEANLALWK